LVRKGDAGAVEDLLLALGDKSPLVRATAAEFLGDLNTQAAITPLIKILGDRNIEVRMWATSSLGTLLTRQQEPAAAYENAGRSECVGSDSSG